MSYTKLLVFVLVIVAIGIGVFLFWSSRDTASPSSQSPSGLGNPASGTSATPNSSAEFVIAFYSWYIDGATKNLRFADSSEFVSTINNWLTPEFVQKWNYLIQQTNANPVLLAQDFDASWKDAVHASVSSQTAEETIVQVTFGTSQHTVYAHLMQQNGSWRIASVTQRP
jgi:hypothetical protein